MNQDDTFKRLKESIEEKFDRMIREIVDDIINNNISIKEISAIEEKLRQHFPDIEIIISGSAVSARSKSLKRKYGKIIHPIIIE